MQLAKTLVTVCQIIKFYYNLISSEKYVKSKVERKKGGTMHKMIFLQRDTTRLEKVHKMAIIFNQENLLEKPCRDFEHIPCFISTDTNSLNIFQGGKG